MNTKILSIAAVAVVLVAAAVFFSGPEVTNPDPSGEAVVCFGDSLTYGTGAAAEMSYPAQLERLIGEPVVNAGVPGDTTAAAAGRLEADVLEANPRIVLITLGGNDLMQGVPAERAIAALESMVLRIQDRGALVVVGGIEAPVFGRGYGGAYAELCDRTGCVLVDNVFDGIMGKKELMADRIHPNDAGYTVMAEHFYRAVKPYL